MFCKYIGSDTTGLTRTQAAYYMVPLADTTPATRGVILEGIVRNAWEKYTGEATYDVSVMDDAVCVNGRKRARCTTSCDFLSGPSQRRVEVKTAQLSWVHCQQRWEVQWRNIKPKAHDVLLLALYTTSGIYLFQHDGIFGVSRHGRYQTSSGGKVQTSAPRTQACVEEATRSILSKMNSMLCMQIPLETLDAATTLTKTQQAYVGAPLALYTVKRRGVLLEHITRRVWEECTNTKTFDPCDDDALCINGSKRSLSCATHDFQDEAGLKYEVKSAQLKWNCTKQRWLAEWMNVKSEYHDRLLLALYTPKGIHMFQHDGIFGVTTRGRDQRSGGGGVFAYAPVGEDSIEQATSIIVKKMEHMLLKTLLY